MARSPVRGKSSQLPLVLPHKPLLKADNLHVGRSNRDAVAWLEAWPAWPAPALVIHGPPACGKSHLLHIWGDQSGAAVATPDTVLRSEPPSLVAGQAAIAIDDAENLTGTAGEQTLLHVYNLLAERGGHLILAARRPASAWPLKLADLSSRLRAAPSVAVGEPDDQLLADVIIKLLKDRQLDIGDDVVRYAVLRMERSFDAAGRLAAALDAASLAARRPISVPLAKTVVDDLFTAE